MGDATKQFVAWLKVSDKPTALAVCKFSALPAFLFGAALLVGIIKGALPIIHNNDMDLIGAVVTILFIVYCLFLIVGSLRIRRGSYGLLPIICLLMFVRIIGYFVDVLPDFDDVNLFIASFQLLFLILVVQGLRGWWWLRKNT